MSHSSSNLSADKMAWISVAILILLFMLQRFGTDKVGYSFAPIITVWFISITGIGIFNFFKYDPWVFKAVNPMYIVDYFRRNGKAAWVSLGGVVLCVTGIILIILVIQPQNHIKFANVIEFGCIRGGGIVC